MASFNEAVFRAIFALAHQNIFLDSAAVFLARYLPIFLIAGAAVYIFFIKSARERIAAFTEVAVSVILARGIITTVIRFVYPVARPFETMGLAPLFTDTRPSFPSGHAAFYFALAMSIYFYNKKVGIIYFGAAILISLSRVFSGVHWPLDILGGALIGILSGILTNRLLKTYKKS